jgi:hypothetical protein
MKNLFLSLFLALALSACDAASGVDLNSFTVQSSPRANAAVTPVTATPAGTPTANQVMTAQAIIAIDGATSTAGAAATGTSYAVTTTSEAQATQAFWVNVTLGVATERGQETKVAQTQQAGTEQADWKTQQPQTVTALVATQAIERAELKSKVASTWIWRVGGSLALVGLLYLLILAGFDARRYLNEKGNAKNLQEKTSAMKPDSQGRYPIIPSASLAKNETLLNPNLMHRAQLDPAKVDDLTSDQALQNTNSLRKLDGVRSISSSPAVGSLLKKMMKDEEAASKRNTTMPIGDVLITKPDQPLLPTAWPELPLPHWKLLNKWDGHLLPFGMDEKAQLMRVDTSTRPHFMVVGRSRSGKTLSSIRPMVACLLTMGWNVIVMGKRVDFMPFEEHPNFKLLAVDVRKDARKYIDILNTMTAQMDARDQILYSAKVSTWDRYGAPSTMIVVDDYSGAIERMPAKQAAEVVSEVKSIAMDGAKFGLNLMLGLQKPTWENIDTTIRSQMGRIVYSVDIGDSRIALGEEGAERLPAQFNFLTRMTDDSSMQRGVGFVLQDAEIEAFLKSRPVAQNEQPDWIDATIIKSESVSAGVSAPVSAPVSGVSVESNEPTADRVNHIREAYFSRINSRKEFSLRDLERDVFGANGGAFFKEVRRAIADIENVTEAEVSAALKDKFTQWKAESATATATSPKMTDFEANPA